MAKKITYNTDEGNQFTDWLIKGYENKIRKEYSKAEQEVEEKLREYLKSFKTKDEIRKEYLKKQYAKYQAGEISWNEYKRFQREYTTWRLGQVAIGERWEEMRNILAEDLTNAGMICQSMLNEYMMEAYAVNFNYGTYLVESESLVNTAFTLYDKSTMERLLRENPQLLPMMSDKTKERILREKLELWNKQKLTSALTQGILQGESIPKIAKRFRNVVQMDYNQSVRTARTAMTSAQNGGRLDSFKRADKMGIQLNKQWLATIDGRTRHLHRMLMDVSVPIDEPFKVEGYELMFPADPSGAPEMVYNCRCTMVSSLKGFEKKITDYDISERLGGMTFEEWQEQDGKSQPIDTQERKGKAIRNSYVNDYKRMKRA